MLNPKKKVKITYPNDPPTPPPSPCQSVVHPEQIHLINNPLVFSDIKPRDQLNAVGMMISFFKKNK